MVNDKSTMRAVQLMKAKGLSIKAMATALKMDQIDIRAICDMIDRKGGKNASKQ